MKKTFKVQDIDCAHCAAKFEEALNKIDGVEKATVNFITQKVIVEADESLMDGIIKQAEKELKKVEPDAELIL